MTHPTRQFYQHWADVLLRQGGRLIDKVPIEGGSTGPSYHRPRGLRLTSTRGVSIWAMDANNRPIIAFGTMTGGYGRVARPLFFVRSNGAFRFCVEDPATKCADLWDDSHMFLRKVHYGRRQFFTLAPPYQDPPWHTSWSLMGNRWASAQKELTFMFLYDIGPILYTYASGGSSTMNGTWFNVSMDYSSPRLIHVKIHDDLDESVTRWLNACEKRSLDVYKRLSKKVKASGGRVQPIPFGLTSRDSNINTQALSQFIESVDIYQPTRPKMEANA